MKIIDLSHIIEAGMPLFSEQAPQPEIDTWLSHDEASKNGHYEDCTCEINIVRFNTSTGTYLDSPYHFDPAGQSIESLTLDQLVLPGVIINCSDAQGKKAIPPNVLKNTDIAGKAVLFKTDWSKHWGETDYLDHPYLSEETALALIDGKAKLAGVDFLVVDDARNPKRPAHVNLLKNNILIVENLRNLGALPENDFIFHAAPVKFRKAAAFPVRAYAMTNN